jgi:hypothetical protein
VGGRWREWEDKGGGRGKGREMTQTLYAHMNKRKKKSTAIPPICVLFSFISYFVYLCFLSFLIIS